MSSSEIFDSVMSLGRLKYSFLEEKKSVKFCLGYSQVMLDNTKNFSVDTLEFDRGADMEFCLDSERVVISLLATRRQVELCAKFWVLGVHL